MNMNGEKLILYILSNDVFPREQLANYVALHGVHMLFPARHAYDAHNKTLLHYAAEFGDKDSIKWLVAHGANINQQDSKGWTPLHYAVDLDVVLATQDSELPRKLPTAKLLAEFGANPNILNKENMSPKKFMPESKEMDEVYKREVLKTANL